MGNRGIYHQICMFPATKMPSTFNQLFDNRLSGTPSPKLLYFDCLGHTSWKCRRCDDGKDVT